MKSIYSIHEAIQYQREEYGCVVLGRDALYEVIRSGRLHVVRVGKRRVFIPKWALDEYLKGNLSVRESGR